MENKVRILEDVISQLIQDKRNLECQILKTSEQNYNEKSTIDCVKEKEYTKEEIENLVKEFIPIDVSEVKFNSKYNGYYAENILNTYRLDIANLDKCERDGDYLGCLYIIVSIYDKLQLIHDDNSYYYRRNEFLKIAKSYEKMI